MRNLKKIVYALTLTTGTLFAVSSANAQVKIGGNVNTINRGAILELESTNGRQSLLLTRNADLTTILNPTKGMIAYYTGNSTTQIGNANYAGEGFYIFTESAGVGKWEKLGSAADVSEKWTKGGDNITDPLKAKLGTINAQGISLITGNGERIKISADDALTEIKTQLTRLEKDVIIGDATATAANSTLDIRGSVSNTTTTVTANTTLDKTHHTVLVDFGGADVTATITITLPAASAANGRTYVIKKLNGGLVNSTMVVATNGADVFNGQATVTTTDAFNDGTTITVQSNGTQWNIIARGVN